ncbi:MAG: hypothetical protein ACFCGT_20610 [Sandaracinaceae bacterium]
MGGSCFQPCLDDPDCGADEICVTFGGGNSECLARCASTADCDAGRLCFPDFDREPVETYCIPHCWRDDQCLGGRCNAWSGLCEEPDLDLGGVEADCDVDADCRSDLCDPDIGCLTLCASDLAGDVCPEGAACIPFDVPGGLGECRSR